MESTKQKQKTAFEAMKKEFGYKNKMAVPRVQKIIVSVGTGKKARADKKWNELVSDRLSKITGQKPAARGAKQSIASFKVRQGDTIGAQITLRGARMFSFFDKLISVAIPRMRDFRGLDKNGIDEMGNFTIGIREHTIFPETSDEDLSDVFGMAITFVTTAHSKNEAYVFFKHLGIPFKK